jgi:hypothetical protein
VSRWTIVPLASLAALGCQVSVVDLGSNRPAGTGGAPGPVTTMDCPYTDEAEINALYGQPCASTCADDAGPPRVVHSSVELVAVTAGRWLTCAGQAPWAADVIGIELQAGCTLFLLHDAPDGGVVRGITPSDQGTYNVVETTFEGATTRVLQLYFPDFTWRVTVTTSDCPHRMRFVGPDGGEIDFVAITAAAGPIE